MLPSSGLRTTNSCGGMFRRLNVVADHRPGVQVIDRNIEKALNLGGVQVEGQHAVGAGGGQQVGDELGGDRHAALVLAVLAGIAVVRQHGRDARRAGALEGIQHDEQLHQVFVDRRQVGCTMKMSRPRTSSSMRHRGLAVGKIAQSDLAEGVAQVAAMLRRAARLARPLKTLRRCELIMGRSMCADSGLEREADHTANYGDSMKHLSTARRDHLDAARNLVHSEGNVVTHPWSTPHVLLSCPLGCAGADGGGLRPGYQPGGLDGPGRTADPGAVFEPRRHGAAASSTTICSANTNSTRPWPSWP